MVGRGGRSNNGRKSNSGEEGGERRHRYTEAETEGESGGAGRNVPKFQNMYFSSSLSLFARSRLQTASSIMDASPLVLCLTHQQTHTELVWQGSNIVGQCLWSNHCIKMWTLQFEPDEIVVYRGIWSEWWCLKNTDRMWKSFIKWCLSCWILISLTEKTKEHVSKFVRCRLTDRRDPPFGVSDRWTRQLR